MNRLRKFRALRPQAKIVVVEAATLLCLIRLLLALFSLKIVRRVLSSFDRLLLPTWSVRTDVLFRLITSTARWCPLGSTCLTRALATQVLLRRTGVYSRLCIGVMRDRHRRFQAHAWLENDHGVVLGGTNEDIWQWIPLAEIEERTA